MPEERIDWVRGRPSAAISEYLEWRAAVELADGGDTQKLVELLRSGLMPGPEARELLADLLSRRQLKKRPGRQATPAYARTMAEAKLDDGAALYKYFRKKKRTGAKALEEVLREQKRKSLGDQDVTDDRLDELITDSEHQKLAYRIRGQRGSTKRMRKRARNPRT